MKISKADTIGERVALVIVALLGIVDGLITLCSFTLLDSDYRAHFLFSDLCDWLAGEDH